MGHTAIAGCWGGCGCGVGGSDLTHALLCVGSTPAPFLSHLGPRVCSLAAVSLSVVSMDCESFTALLGAQQDFLFFLERQLSTKHQSALRAAEDAVSWGSGWGWGGGCLLLRHAPEGRNGQQNWRKNSAAGTQVEWPDVSPPGTRTAHFWSLLMNTQWTRTPRCLAGSGAFCTYTDQNTHKLACSCWICIHLSRQRPH